MSLRRFKIQLKGSTNLFDTPKNFAFPTKRLLSHMRRMYGIFAYIIIHLASFSINFGQMSWNIWVWIVFFSLSNALNAKPRSISPWEQQLQTVKICVTWKTAHSHCNCDLPLSMHGIAVCETDSIQSQHIFRLESTFLGTAGLCPRHQKTRRKWCTQTIQVGAGGRTCLAKLGSFWPKPGNLEGPHVFIMANTFFSLLNGKNMGMLDPDHTTYNIQNFRIILTLIEGLVSTKKIWSVVSLLFFLGCFFLECVFLFAFFCWNR